ncbi:hypothetical protein I4U23_024703 [Adineta vaga]|nr:hypothetical protein I4U23_024703 [Adineta vaga]
MTSSINPIRILLFLTICWLLILSSNALNTNDTLFHRYYKSFRSSSAPVSNVTEKPTPSLSTPLLKRRSAYIPGFCYPVQVGTNTYVMVCLHNGFRKSVYLIPNPNEVTN